MEDFLSDYLSKNHSESQHTRTAMIGNIRRIERMINKPIDEWNVYSDFGDVEAFILNLNSKFSYNTSISTIHGILVWLNYMGCDYALIDRYRNYLNDYIEVRNIMSYDNVMSDEERKNWLDYPTLKEKVISLNEKFLGGSHAFTKFRNYMILALYTLAYPVRLGNYIDMRYMNDQTEDLTNLPRKYNYIVKGRDGNYTFIFNKYKTSKTLGQIIYKPENLILQRLLRKWYANYNKNNSLFLVNTKGESMSQTNLTNALSSTSLKLIGKQMSLNTIRQSFITDFLKKENTIKERRRVLKIIGQLYTPSMTDLYVRL